MSKTILFVKSFSRVNAKYVKRIIVKDGGTKSIGNNSCEMIFEIVSQLVKIFLNEIKMDNSKLLLCNLQALQDKLREYLQPGYIQ